MLHHVWCNGTVQERSAPHDRPAPEAQQAVGDEIVASKCVPVKQGVVARESANAKLDERTVVPQVSLNPFIKTTDYVHDLEVQARFLRPQSSHNEVERRLT